MALVLNETQSYKGSAGLLTFYLNRALRIFLPYWLVLLAVVIAARFDLFPDSEAMLNKLFAHPLVGIANNMFLIPQAIENMFLVYTENRLIIGAMLTVGLELIFYAIAPFIVRRSLPALATITGMAWVVHFLPYQLGLPSRPWQYEVFPYIFCFFMLGVLSYRFYVFLNRFDFDWRWGWIAIPIIASFIVADRLNTNNFTNSIAPLTFYFLVAALLPGIFLASKNSLLDRAIGDLSYPIYIVHIPIIWLFKGNDQAQYMVPIWAITASIWLTLIVERPINSWRHKLRLPIADFSGSVLARCRAIIPFCQKAFAPRLAVAAVATATAVLVLWSKAIWKTEIQVPPPFIHVSSQYENYGADGLLDSRQPGWHAASPVVFPQSVTIDFNNIFDIQSLSFLPQDGNFNRMPKEMVIEASEDGDAWREVAAVRDLCSFVDKEGWREVELPPRVHGRLLRLVIHKNCGDPSFLALRGLKIKRTVYPRESETVLPTK